jgi:hypothetical protein
MAELRQSVWRRDDETSPNLEASRMNSEDPVDAEGIPAAAPTSEWLDLLDAAGPVDPRASRWFLAVLRFSRPDGSPVFGPRGRLPARLRALQAWAVRIGDPSLAAVISEWLPARSVAAGSLSVPPLPSYRDSDRPLAILRADWGPTGDLAAVDHRRLGDETLVEVAVKGRALLGPSWTSGELGGGKPSSPLPTSRSSSPFADAFEWSYRLGTRRVTRSLVLLRGRSMALLGQQDDGGDGRSEVRFALAEGVEARPAEGSPALVLSAGRSTARLIPLGLPAVGRPTDSRSIAVEGRQVVIRQAGEGRRRWVSALICWGKPPTTWRSLTVAERSKACKEDVASAVRVAWGPNDEGLVIYRSLAAPALRSFLGHQTNARILIGGFGRTGEVRPILKVGS